MQNCAKGSQASAVCFLQAENDVPKERNLSMKKLLSAVTALMVMTATASYTVHAEENEQNTQQYTVTFLDFDDKEWLKLTVSEGDVIDYSAIDTSSLHRYKDIYTEQVFSSWDITPETVAKDTTIRALALTASISIDGIPDKTHYFYADEVIDLKGLSVMINVEKEVPVERSGKVIIVTEKSKMDVTSSCEARPKLLKDAFTQGKTAEIKVYPINEDQPITSYTVNCHPQHGDANGNGKVDAVDSAAVLRIYTNIATGGYVESDRELIYRADADLDGKLTANDASIILSYYTAASAHIIPDWNTLISGT